MISRYPIIHNIIGKASLIACLSFFTPTILKSQNDGLWVLDGPLQEAYHLSLKFHISQSRNLLNDYSGPSDFGKLYLEHVNDVLELLVSEEDLLFEEFDNMTDQRINALKDAPDHPYKRFYQSEIKLHKTFIHLKYGEELSAAWNFRQAYLWAERNKEDYPGFPLTLKNLGLMHIIIGSTPEKYQWLLKLFGFKGSIKRGLTELNELSKSGTIFTLETDLLLAFVYSYLLQESEKGLLILNQYAEQRNQHLLMTYATSSLLIKSSQSELALEVINEYKGSTEGFGFLDYQMANILQQKGEYDSSTHYFLQFATGFNGQNYQKDVYYKIGLNYYLDGKTTKALEYFDISENVGQRVIEADKNASYMLQQGLPDKNLMKLRLAIDGGYFDLAKLLVKDIQQSGSKNFMDSTEFIYRQARLLHKSGRAEKAIIFYKETIESSGSQNWYFAPNAALQLGYIYRNKGQNDEAQYYFEKAQSFKNHPYKNSIDNKAKAALDELD